MRNTRHFLAIFTLLLSFSALSLYSQSGIERSALDYIINKQGPFSNVNLSDEALKISSFHKSKPSGTTHIYFQQVLGDLTIYNAVGSVHLNDAAEIQYATNRFINPESHIKQESEDISLHQAVYSTAAHFGIQSVDESVVIQSETSGEKAHVLQNEKMAHGDIAAKLVLVPVDGQLRLAWNISFEKRDDHFWWNVRVDAQTGEIIDKNSWTVECNFDDHAPAYRFARQAKRLKSQSLPGTFLPNTYNVYSFPVEAPSDGSRSMITEPWNTAPNASPFGWHDIDGLPGNEFTDTRGNNVFAQEDADGDDFGGDRPDGGPNLEFDFPIDLNMSPPTYLDAATTNLFYANNFLHDVTYQYGFDESAGNFQYNNYGNGGLQDDQVYADAQDGDDVNNATFFTPPDGSSPRMQMFQWTSSANSAEFEVTFPGSIAQTFESAKATFGEQGEVSIAGTLVMTEPNDACVELTNAGAISGNIALIDRGTCLFIEKVNRAELAGATAAIVCNNIPGDGVFGMGGDEPPVINIASGMLSFEDCEIIKAEMPGVQGTYRQFDVPNLDSDLDNGIIAHEYGHGISNRLTGGAANPSCLGGEERMGEGWSDFMTLITTMKEGDLPGTGRGIGTYVIGQPIVGGNGIRPFPYSPDMNINPHSYDSIKDPGLSVPHGVGSVWNAMLWEMVWNLVRKYGFDPDIYYGTGGNNIALQLVLEGMKLQPCNPGFVDGRDAILQADLNLYGGANQCEIWRAFAKRGLGTNADQGSHQSRFDGTEDYSVPEGCELDPCDVYSITFEDETIPDNTILNVEDNIVMQGMVDLAGPNATVILSAGWSVDIEGEFEAPASSTLTIDTEPCQNGAPVNPAMSKQTSQKMASRKK